MCITISLFYVFANSYKSATFALIQLIHNIILSLYPSL